MSPLTTHTSHPARRALWVSALIVVAAVGTYELALIQTDRPAVDVAAVNAPLRFDPPAAGPDSWRAAYGNCIAHPAPDGSTADCVALLKDDSPRS